MDSPPHTVIAGKYQLCEIAGQGGMATVWRAIMRGAAGFSRPVALKRILPQLVASDEFVAMFVEEARVGSELVHPHIVQILDFGMDEQGAYFLVMEWVDGLDLGRYVEGFRLMGQPAPWPLVAAIVLEALRGLACAHARVDACGRPFPVFHRDVTPQNILIGVNGIAKLSDFGLARAMDRARMTRPDIVKGKLAYLAPEVTLGQPVTVQSDIFAMGIVLWEALAGRRLYHGQTDLQVFMAARAAEIPPVRTVRPDVPEGIGRVLTGALAREPERRFASAEQMIRAITETLRNLTLSTDSFTLSQSVIAARRALRATPPR